MAASVPPAPVPIAVHPYDLDTVFLSKTVVSLPDVFSHAIDDLFDLAPLPRCKNATPPPPPPAPAESSLVDAHASSLPFSGGAQPYAASSRRDAAHETSATAAHDYAEVTKETAAHSLLNRYHHHGAPLQAPALRVVPLDAYHLLLSYRDVDVADGDGSTQQDAGFGAATKHAVTAVAMLSADAPGCRPPRSGVCVVRRVEGDMKEKPVSAEAGLPRTTFPTASRVVQHLPFTSFEGWVRDYTVYGLARNAAVLREAWADKVRERGAYDGVGGGEGGGSGGSGPLSEKSVGPAGDVVEVSDTPASAAMMEALSPSPAPAPQEPAAPPAAEPDPPSAPHSEHSGEQGEKAVETSEAVAAAAAVSPSLERLLQCSSTTASSPASSLTNRSNASAASPPNADGSVPPPPLQRQQSGPQQEQLWEEERRREAIAAARLAHRFVVSDSVHHAIWAIEATLPAMAVRVVAPAEFYTLEEVTEAATDAVFLNGGMSSTRRGVPQQQQKKEEEDEKQESASAPSVVQLPQKRSATAVTASQTRPRSPSPVAPQHFSAAAVREGVDSSSPASATTQAPHDASPSPSHSPRDPPQAHSARRGRSTKSASPSVALAEALPAPLMGGARGFVDGHFSVARFNGPGALCWRVDEAEEEREDDDVRVYPLRGLQNRRRCSVLFISDVGNCAIRYANFHNRLVRTIAGMDGVPGYRDGSCASSLLRGATALAWCSAGLLFADGPNSVVRLITHVGKASQKEASVPAAVREDATAATVESKDVLEALTTNAATAAAPADDGAVIAAVSGPSPEREVGTNAALRSSSRAVPRVWTLAGSVDHHTVASTQEGDCGDAGASYVDSSTPSRARFGFLSDMALRVDETGNTQLLLLDQTHHAVRIVDGEGGGVSTYVGPLDYAAKGRKKKCADAAAATATTSVAAATADALPPGLTYPSSLALCALIKERSPALLDNASKSISAAEMLTPQPYLYSSTPLLFVASAVTGVVSVLLPVSQRSGLAPWNALGPSTAAAAAAATATATATAVDGEQAGAAPPTSAPTNSNAAQGVLEGIHAALTLGVATEGRRTIGEATAPSLKHVVPGWGIGAAPTDDNDDAEEEENESAAVQRLLRCAALQQALLYLRLRFPWVLPPAVPQLHPRLVAGCSCHMSGKRRGAAQQMRTSYRPDSFVGSGGANARRSVATGGVAVSLLPRSSRSLSRGASPSPASSPVRHPVQPQRLLFHTPPRHPAPSSAATAAPATGSYALAMADPRTVAAAREVAELLRVQPRAVVEAAEAPATIEKQQPRPTSRSGSSSASEHSSQPPQEADDDGAEKRVADAADVADEETNHEQQQQQARARAAAALKWLPPPTKSLSRSPMSTPRGGCSDNTTANAPAAAAAAADAAEALPAELPTTPPRQSTSTPSYAVKFQRLPAEQRQLRLLQTLDEAGQEDDEDVEEEASSPQPMKPPQTTSATDKESHKASGGATRHENTLSPSHSSSSSLPRQSRLHHTASRSPNSSGRVSPPLTPRAMAAHQLMQRRRTSRSNTAPHVASVGSTATAAGKEASQDPTEQQTHTKTAGAAAAVGVGGATDVGNDDSVEDAPPPQQQQQQQVSAWREKDHCRSPSHTVHEAGDTQLTPTSGALTAPSQTVGGGIVALPRPSLTHFHDAYDAAVRRLFSVYTYFATRTVTHTTTAAIGAGSRRLSSPVEHYSMSFSAFHRFLVLTGYLDFIAGTATQAQQRRCAAGGSERDYATPAAILRLAPRGGSTQPSPWRWWEHLAQVQRRGAATVAAPSLATFTEKRSTHAVSSSAATRRASRTTVSSASTSLSNSAAISLLPLAATDSRAVADVLYSCGVRLQGYHVVNRMDFQAFRRAVLLLRTWAVTAHEKSNGSKGGEEGEAADAEAGFAFLDCVPSLDALSAEEVVATYAEVYAQAVRMVPALAKAPFNAGSASGEEESGEGNHQSVQALTGKAPGSRPSSTAAHRGEDGNMHDNGGRRSSSIGDGGEERAVTPPVSPISFVKDRDEMDDLFCLAAEAPISGHHEEDGEKEKTCSGTPPPPPPYTAATLLDEERRALDDLLRLLQLNEGTLRQLFDAYSVPVVVHRSSRYEAPHSAAAAAAVSNPCSLILNDSRSFGSGGGGASRGEASRVVGVGEGQTKMWDSITSQPTGTRPRAAAAAPGRSGTATAASSVSRSVPSAGTAMLHLTTGISPIGQDMWWKVQQLYTMSSLESKEVYERTSRTVQVVPYKHFVELWRTVDVFPALMNATATQQAYLDAVTTTLLRGSGSTTTSAPTAGGKSAPQPPPARVNTNAASASAAYAKEVQDLLFHHTGLPFPCFVEAFVRVAMTVFSHEVDRVAYPTSVAKATGLMQWCNKQVLLGLVGQRQQQQLRTSTTFMESGSISGGGVGGAREGGSRRGSHALSSSSMRPATRPSRSSGQFPDHLQLFRVPGTHERA